MCPCLKKCQNVKICCDVRCLRSVTHCQVKYINIHILIKYYLYYELPSSFEAVLVTVAV